MMSRTVKWIIGILIGLLAVAVVLTLAFMASSRIFGLGWGMRPPQVWEGGETPWDDMPMSRMMPFWGFGRSFPLMSCLTGLLCVFLPLLIVLGVAGLAVGLVRGERRRGAMALEGPAAPGVPAAPIVPPVVEREEAVTMAESCPNCGRRVEAGWRNCPWCGEELGEGRS